MKGRLKNEDGSSFGIAALYDTKYKELTITEYHADGMYFMQASYSPPNGSLLTTEINMNRRKNAHNKFRDHAVHTYLHLLKGEFPE